MNGNQNFADFTKLTEFWPLCESDDDDDTEPEFCWMHQSQNKVIVTDEDSTVCENSNIDNLSDNVNNVC